MHKKKMIAPIVITFLILLYYIGFACVILFINNIPLFVKLLGGIIPLLFMGVLYICFY